MPSESLATYKHPNIGDLLILEEGLTSSAYGKIAIVYKLLKYEEYIVFFLESKIFRYSSDLGIKCWNVQRVKK